MGTCSSSGSYKRHATVFPFKAGTFPFAQGPDLLPFMTQKELQNFPHLGTRPVKRVRVEALELQSLGSHHPPCQDSLAEAPGPAQCLHALVTWELKQ